MHIIIEQQILSWKDKYKTRIDEDLTNLFPKLELSLREQVEKHALKNLTGHPQKFTRTILEPEITKWVDQYALPIVKEAQKELSAIIAHTLEQNMQIPNNTNRHNWHGGLTTIGIDVVAPIASIVAGIGIMAGSVVLAITTSFWGFTTINWPILVCGLVGGTLLNTTGIVKLSQLKRRLLSRCSKIFIPQVRTALIGEGYKHKGQHYDSLKRQMQNGIEEATQKILAEIRK